MTAFNKVTGNTKRFVSLMLVILGGVVVALVVFQPDVQWRAKVVQHKLAGSLPSIEFLWMLEMLSPGSPIYLEKLASTPNPYAVIRNPQTSHEDIKVGGELFQSRCSSCHRDDGHNSATTLLDDNYAYGDSDWAIYRVVNNGIDGTGMSAINLSEKSIWQVIAYLRYRSEMLADSSENTDFSLKKLEPITSSRIQNRPEEPNNWLTYSGTLDGQRFSNLDQITKDNVARLKLAWVYQGSSHNHDVEATPIVVDGVLITTEPPGSVIALNAESGRVIWRYNRQLPDDLRICCGPVNRGVAVANSSVIVGTIDAHLVALDIYSGKVVWDVETAPHSDGYSKTAAPLIVNDHVITGIAGGEYGIRGFIDAYDVNTGERRWRFYTIPMPGDPGSETWLNDSWETGGGPTWMTGSYDIDTNLIYWGTGNPGPDFNNDSRKGNNLFTNSIVALDLDSGSLQWSFQFTPDDVYDYDANHVPIVADLPISGNSSKVVMIATKNGFFYVLDAKTGRFISAMEISRQSWALGLDAKGHPIRNPSAVPKSTGTRIYPGTMGGANWFPASFNPELQLLYLPVIESGSVYFSADQPFERGNQFMGGSTTVLEDDSQHTVLRAIDPINSEVIWEHRGSGERNGLRTGGTFGTVTGIQFWGDSNFLVALDSASGKVLWRANLGGQIVAAPMTYSVNDKQYVAVSAGRGLFVFSL